MMQRLLNLSMRSFVLFLKFLSILILAKILEPKEFAIYGLATAAIGFSVYPLGLDFYTFNIRELINSSKQIRGKLLKSQLFLHGSLYILFFPFLLLIFAYEILPIEIIYTVSVLIVSEHLGQELYRILIALNRQISATLSLFFRQGSWVLILIYDSLIDPTRISVELALEYWVFGSLVSLVFGISVLVSEKMSGWTLSVDWQWIAKGLRISFPLLIASITLNSISTLDRYWFASLQDKDTLAAYVFYMSICSALLSLVDAALFSFMYPRLIKAVSSCDFKILPSLIKQLERQTAGFLFVLTLALIAIIDSVVGHLDRQLYLENKIIFYIILSSMLIHIMSYVHHYALYAFRQDSLIMQIHIQSFLIFIVLVPILSRFDPLLSIPFSLLTAYVFILIRKYIEYKNIVSDALLDK